jgi:hypothetical protein
VRGLRSANRSIRAAQSNPFVKIVSGMRSSAFSSTDPMSTWKP